MRDRSGNYLAVIKVVGVAAEERLRVGVHRDELHAGQACVDHAVDGVRTAAADTDDLEDGKEFL